MSLTAEKLVAVLERRYDYHSARVVFRQVVARAGLSEGGPFGAPELDRFATALDEVGDRLGDLLEAIRAQGGKGASAPAKAAPAPEAPASAPAASPKAPAAEPADAPAKEETAAEAAPAASADTPAKSDGRDDRQQGNQQGNQQGKKKG